VSVILIDTANMIMPRNANKVARMRRTALTCHLRSCSLSRRRVSIDNIGAMMEEMRVDAKKDRSGLLRVRVSRGAGWSRVDQQGIKNYARAKEGYTLPTFRIELVTQTSSFLSYFTEYGEKDRRYSIYPDKKQLC